MATFTVIIGSAYGDATPAVYIADAVDPQTVCAYVTRVASAQDSNMKTVLFCMKGVVEFCPTLFLMGHKALVPSPIDLRGPGTSKLSFFVDAANYVYISTNKALEAIMPLRQIVAELREHNVIVEFETPGEIKARAYYGTDFTQRMLIDLISRVSSHKAIVDIPATSGKPGGR